MLICQAMLGDSSVTLYRVMPLVTDNDSSDKGVTYTLRFHDLPTSTTEDVVFTSENEAVLSFAAWLMADEEEVGGWEDKLAALKERMKTKDKFFP